MRLRTKVRLILPAVLTVGVAAAGLTPGVFSANGQTRSSRRPTLNRAAPRTPFSKGYANGYEAGFTQGAFDWRQRAPRDFQHSDAFQQREARYDQTLASDPDYRNGFDLGFELGYTDGYYGRSHNAIVPLNAQQLRTEQQRAEQQRAEQQRAEEQRAQPSRDDQQRNEPRDEAARHDTRPRQNFPPRIADIPGDTEVRLRLTSAINTQTARVGDRFTATIVSPTAYDGTTVEGHIATLKKSGKVSGKTELGLAFDNVTYSDGRRAPFNAQLDKIIQSESVKKIDEEGRVESGNKTTDSEKRGGIGAVAGAVIGGLAGGGKGAVIGAIIGGAAGVGTVAIEGNKDLILENGTEMIARTIESRPR